MLEKTEGAIKNGQSRETGKTGHIRHKTKTHTHNKDKQINFRENRRGNQEWTIQRHWKDWAHKKQDEKTHTTMTNK